MEKLKEEMTNRTNWFRGTSDPMETKIKQLLSEKGINPEITVLVQLFPDDSCLQYGILITKNKEIFQFGYNYLNNNADKGYFSEWEDLKSIYTEHRWQKEIECGLSIPNL